MLVMDAPWGGVTAALEGLHCQLSICTPVLSTKLSVGLPYPTTTSKGAAAQQRAASPSSALFLPSCALPLLLQ